MLFLIALLLAAIFAVSCSDPASTPAEQDTAELAQSTATESPAPTSTSRLTGTATSPPQLAPAIRIQPDSALLDEAVKIEVVGLEPDQTVTLTATLRDNRNRDWESIGVFTADEQGVVDLTTQAPITGTYDAVDPMGLLWSMAPDVPDPEYSYFANPGANPVVVTFNATTADAELGPAYLRRVRLPSGVQRATLSMEEHGLEGQFFAPAGAEPHPALLILGGSGGFPDIAKAELLAAHGYATLALDYFGGPSLPDALAEIPLEYFKKGIDWLQAQDVVDADKLGVVGTSRGGELALLLGATYPQLKVVVSYVGSGVPWAGYGSTEQDLKPAWTYEGAPVPFPTSENELEEAAIAVEQINGPVLLISGQDDRVWSSTKFSEIALIRLRQNNHSYEYEHLAYEDAGHFIGVPYWPTRGHFTTHSVTGEQYTAGGTPEGNAHASADSWAKVLSFLQVSFE